MNIEDVKYFINHLPAEMCKEILTVMSLEWAITRANSSIKMVCKTTHVIVTIYRGGIEYDLPTGHTIIRIDPSDQFNILLMARNLTTFLRLLEELPE